MNSYCFDSQTEVVGKLPDISDEEFRDEPMLFKCDYGHARMFGGQCTHAFLDALSTEWKTSEILMDTRVHMLMPGWYPCIPGWHHDDVPRDRFDGQPAYPPRYKSKHVMAFWGDVSRTEFAVGNAEFGEVPANLKVYSAWNSKVEKHIDKGRLVRTVAAPQTIYSFDWQSWHRGSPATDFGWRFFIRATRSTEERPVNKIRRQVQVYLENVNKGW